MFSQWIDSPEASALDQWRLTNGCQADRLLLPLLPVPQQGREKRHFAVRPTHSESVSFSLPPTECPILVCRVRGPRAARQPPVASSDSSGTETPDGQNVFRPQSSREKRCSHKPDAGDRRADGANRPGESPTRQGLDWELQTFISMRDKTDKATEVREPERSCCSGGVLNAREERGAATAVIS